MKKFDKSDKLNHINSHWPNVPDHLSRILVVRSSELGKSIALLNIINH